MVENYDLICITGLKRSGKDTTADLIFDIMKQNRVKVERSMLALKLKEFLILSIPQNLTLADVNGDTKFDREKELTFTKNAMFIAIDSFLFHINQYIEKNKIETSFNPRNSSDIGRKIISDRFTHLSSVRVSNRDFTTEEVKISVRSMLQIFGTEIARCDDDALWSKITENEFKTLKMFRPNSKFIITDMRMDVEVDYFKNSNFKPYIISVVRPDNKSIPNHITDMGINAKFVNTQVVNDSTIEELKEKLTYILKDIKWL